MHSNDKTDLMLGSCIWGRRKGNGRVQGALIVFYALISFLKL